MSKYGTSANPIEKVLATEIEATTYVGLPAGVADALLTQYYDHNFTWAGTVSTSSPHTTFDITHNVGRPADKVVVYYKGTNGWYEHYPTYTDSGGGGSDTFYGWDTVQDGAIDEDNLTRIRLWTNQEASASDALVRLLWFTNDNIDTATTGLKGVALPVAVGQGGTQYYDHNTTWGSAAGTGIQHTVDVTHNVGRPPDKVVVYYKGVNGWYEHYDVRIFGGSSNQYGWSAVVNAALDENNITRVLLYGNQELVSADALIRLFWTTDDDIETAVDGLKIAESGGGKTILTDTEYSTGSTFDGKIIYEQYVDFGSMPNNGTINVAHNITTIDKLLDYSAISTGPTGDHQLMGFPQGDTPLSQVTGTNVRLTTTNSTFATYTATFFLQYTKV